MKTRLLLLLLVSTLTAWAGKTTSLTINWTFKNVVEGYDYDCKMMVYVDGELKGESGVFKQTAHGNYTLEVPKGLHEVFVQIYAMYDGKWDIHTIENSYAIDGMHRQKVALKSKLTMDLIFDVDVNVPEVNLLVRGKPMKVKMGVLKVEWSFTGLQENKNHENKLLIYVDGKLMGESKTYLESEKATMTVRVPQGLHSIHIENSTSFEGKWEPHTKANGYALDAFYRGSMELGEENAISLVFDIEKGQTLVNVK